MKRKKIGKKKSRFVDLSWWPSDEQNVGNEHLVKKSNQEKQIIAYVPTCHIWTCSNIYEHALNKEWVNSYKSNRPNIWVPRFGDLEKGQTNLLDTNHWFCTQVFLSHKI